MRPLFDAEFFVSPSGDDRHAGTEGSPFQTLERARDAARHLRRHNSGATVRIIMRGGLYRLSRTVVFDLRDSAPEDAVTEIAAFPGEQPILSGSFPLPGAWRPAPPDLPRLPEAARGKVWETDVPENWPIFRALFQGGKRLPRARTHGFHQIKTAPAGCPPIDRRHLYLPPEALQRIGDFDQAEMLVIPEHPWVMNILPMTKVDRATGLVFTDTPATYPLRPPRYKKFAPGTLWIENVLEALDAPGRWVFDAPRRKLFLWPGDGSKPAPDIEAPRLTELVRVEGRIDLEGPTDEPVRGLVFRGLTFTQTDRWPWEADKIGRGLQHDWEMFDRPTAMLRFRGAESCRVEACRFIHGAAAGVRLDLHAQRIAITRCEFGYLGGIGVLLAGYGMGLKDVNRDNTVTDCHVHHVGQAHWHAAGIWAWQSGHNLIARNRVHHTPYTGILVTGRTILDPAGEDECSRTVRWNEVSRTLGDRPPTWKNREPLMHARGNDVCGNEIHHCMEVLYDGNAIYVSGAGGGNRVRYNWIHDVTSAHMGAAIRCDDDQEDVVIERNIIARVCGHGITLKGRNTVRFNILYDLRDLTPEGVPCEGKKGYWVLPYGSVAGSVIRQNIVVSRTANQVLLFERSSPAPPDKPDLTPALLRECDADCNLYFNTAEPGWGQRHLDAQRPFGIEQHSIEADPRFRDPEHDDFSLMPDSPAWRMGFELQEPGMAVLGPRRQL